MVKAIKVMLIPNNVQKTKLFQYTGASRFAYNWALAKEIENYKKGGKFISDAELRKEFTKLRHSDEYAWLLSISNNVIKKEKLLLKRNHRLTNIRKNYLNQTISEIVNRKPRFICIEDLNVSGMMKNRHLSKAVQEQGFFGFRKQLEYKCNDKGILLIVADRFYPSSKLCSCCGNIKKDLKPVSECQFFSFFDLFPKLLYLLYQN